MSPTISTAKHAYYELVWNYVRRVPYGKVITYGQIALALPEPNYPVFDEQSVSISQLVGSAMAACPDNVPWHRVINAQGRVSSRTDAVRQQQLLEAEGLIFYQGRLSLDESQWQGDNQTNKPQQHSLF